MIDEYRKKIDGIDDKIAALYNERMALAKEIGIEKAKNNSFVTDRSREKSIINRVTGAVDEGIAVFTKQLFETVFETSKAYQNRFLSTPQPDGLSTAIENADKPFPVRASVACQGAEGSYSSIAAEKLFALSDISYFKSFDAVFNAVEKGFCAYGVLPIENSTAGSVNEVYDLMRKHSFYIVRSVRLPIFHSLLAKMNVKKEQIREIFSHGQALDQCSEFIASLGDRVKITVCENTAVAARAVASSDRNDIACIASEDCGEIYSLRTLQKQVQNNKHNYTRFICISKQPEIFAGSNKISIMANLPHEPGSLNRLLNKFSVLGLNLTKLESRPLEGSGFEFMFYFDFDGDIRTEEAKNLIAELNASLPAFVFLGSYLEVR